MWVGGNGISNIRRVAGRDVGAVSELLPVADESTGDIAIAGRISVKRGRIDVRRPEAHLCTESRRRSGGQSH